MARKSSVQNNDKRRELVRKFKARRDALKVLAKDASATPEDQFKARLKLSTLPRNSSPIRVRNRCAISGRPRGVYRKFMMSRIAMRDLGSKGLIPGMVKSSW